MRDKGSWWGAAVFGVGLLVMGIHKFISQLLEDDNNE
jgi:hypothetical protein